MNKDQLVKLVQFELSPLIEKMKKSRIDFILKGSKAKYKDFRGEWQEIKHHYSKKDVSLMDWSDEEIMLRISARYSLALDDIATKISHKLQSIDVSSIELVEKSAYFIEFLINGKQRFTVDTIQAGGYNIQCLHYRTTYKLWK